MSDKLSNALRDYIVGVTGASKPVNIQIYTYRSGGIELAPMQIAPAYVPERFREHEEKLNIEIDGEEKVITIKHQATLTDGDQVVVARLTGINKYIILEKYAV